MLDRLSSKLAYNNYSPANTFDNDPLNSGEGWRSTFPDEQPHSSALTRRLPYARDSPPRLAARFKKLLSRFSISPDSISTSSSRRSLGPLTAASPSSAVSTTRFILLCSLWYTTSALSSNTGKTILNQFEYPVTLTIIQFAFVAGYCLLFMSPVIQFTKLRSPTSAIFRTTFPMGMFQVGGHMFSSMAISRIPVSIVHTIKVWSFYLFLDSPCDQRESRLYLRCSPLLLTPSFSVSSTPRTHTSRFSLSPLVSCWLVRLICPPQIRLVYCAHLVLPLCSSLRISFLRKLCRQDLRPHPIS